MRKSLKSFSTRSLEEELQRREKLADEFVRIEDKVTLTKEEKIIIKHLRKEMEVLSNGLKYPIKIGGIPFDFIIAWESEDKSDLDYDGSYKLPNKSPETKIVAEAIDMWLSHDPYEATEIPAVAKAVAEVDARIAQVIAESDRLAKKYHIDDCEFFETFVQ